MAKEGTVPDIADLWPARAAAAAQKAADRLGFAGWCLDVSAKTLTDPVGADIRLTPAEFALLETMVRCAGRVLSRDQLLDAVAARDATPFDRTIDNLVSRLRRKIELDPARPRIILTIPRFGYKLLADRPADVRRPIACTGAPRRPPGAVVVLPLAAADADAGLAAAITEALAADLARRADRLTIRVGTEVGEAARRRGAAAVSRSLGALYAVTGSVRRHGNGAQVAIQLIEAGTGAHLWSDRSAVDAITADDDTVGLARLVHGLDVQIRLADGLSAELEATGDAQALMALGRARLLRCDALQSFRSACGCFERVLEVDPGSVAAMAALGTALAWLVTSRWSGDTLGEERRATALLRRVRAIDPHHVEANWGLGALLRWQGRPLEAIELLRDADERDPANPLVLSLLGAAHVFAGRPAEAVPILERSIAVGGGERDLLLAYWALGSCYHAMGHTDEALTWLLRGRARNPGLPHFHLRLSAVLGQLGDLADARRALAEARALVSPAARRDFASLTALRGHPQTGHPPYRALAEPTLFDGLRRAGMAEA